MSFKGLHGTAMHNASAQVKLLALACLDCAQQSAQLCKR